MEEVDGMKKTTWWMVALIAGCTLFRLVPHAPNFTPILAVALFSGQFLKSREWAFLVPLLAMAATDLFLGFHATAWAVYLSLAIGVFWGRAVGRKSPQKDAPGIAALLGSPILFFVVTNFAVWVQTGMYPKTGSGLIECYVVALPFFQNTLLSTGVFGLALYGARVVVKTWRPQYVEG